MSVIGFFPGMQWCDPASGHLTGEAQRLLALLVQGSNGEGANVTVDGQQTLTNKTISGNRNIIEDVDTNSLKSRTGDANSVVTSNGGSPGFLMAWGSNGDAESGPETILVLTRADADDRYVPRDGSNEATAPIRAASYTVATVPAAADYTQGIIYVSDEAGGATLAFSDGSNWRRVQDRAVVS